MADSFIQGLPKWLENAHNAAHITLVLRTLQKRERTRMAARAASKHQSHPSKRHRISHFASTIATKAEHISYYSVATGLDPANEHDNRYVDIVPYDRTRVIVGPGEPGKDGSSPSTSGRYLNANWVRELAGGKWWIATQAPLPHTAHAFLSVIMEGISPPPGTAYSVLRNLNKVRTIVQLTQNLEGGMRKAHVYFPPVQGQSWVLEPERGCSDPPIQVTLVRSTSIEEAHCVQSVISLRPLAPDRTPVGEPVLFQHLLYASWPDHGVPAREDRDGLLRFTRLVDEANRDLSLYTGVADLDPNPPIMVNCSAGVGRTGAFIAISSLLRYYRFLSPAAREGEPIPPLPPSPLGPLPEELQDDLVALEIDSLREQRPGMVQRDDQVVLIYETLVAAFASAVDGSAANTA
ncbi:phosphatases II [Pilatotrama ljubarskyi]|nr:phosphatases II [Pilatotrama ljubarskyi]